ncbi:hypothetical protein GTP38_23300 [Duganella sp. FT94W]|uniref:PhiE125 gp8 family phage protein n=1 Tax=Duganella lactea TaxID=2692173 RepID=A0ABW9VE25_9BURK|nr:hypothetical protein [Duganella lactea]MYM37257.1 hypothetical protein [Duganella lactea]
MKKILLSGPTALAVSLAAAKANLRVDGDYLDEVITAWLEGIISVLEHEIGQCLMRQTWRLVLPAFPLSSLSNSADVCTCAIVLPHPVLKVNSLTYVDVAGDEQTMPDVAYELSAGEIETALLPASGTSWPTTAVRPDAVIVEVECGYGDEPGKVPACIRLYILAKLVEQFDPTSKPDKNSVQSAYLERMLDRCRTYR